MTSIKVKFRKSLIEGKEGSIYYQVIHEKSVRQIRTLYKILPHEWSRDSQIIVSSNNPERESYLAAISARITLEESRLNSIVTTLKRRCTPYSADTITSTFGKRTNGVTLKSFMQLTISRLIQLQQYRTSETYRTALNSFMRFRDNEDISLADINSGLMLDYEIYLKRHGVSMNSISFYMRILRAVYNRAVDDELIEQRFPFKKVYTGIAKTIKRALPLRDIKNVKELDLSTSPKLMFARDMFLFSFYTRGMSFVDIAYLRKRDLDNGVICYHRRKTGQRLHIKWERCMQEIVSRYSICDTEYLLPIIRTKDNRDGRYQYRNSLSVVNRHLKIIARLAGVRVPLTMYVARHSWASIAKSRNIPISVISEGMGHDSESTTQIYLSSLDSAVVDRANNTILKLL
ncbi:MAG: site-specific integrase [Rikenellaceae bacterium]